MPTVEDRDFGETHCRPPRMNIDIVHRRACAGDREFLAINVGLIPFSLGLDRFFAMNDPFRFWGLLAEAAWWPWLRGPRAITSQSDRVRRLPPAAKK